MEFLVHSRIKSILWTARSLVNEAIPDYSSLCWHLSIYEIPMTYRKTLWDQAYWGTCLINYFSWPIILLIVKFGDSFSASIAQDEFILMTFTGKMNLAVLHTHLSQKRIFMFCAVSYSFPTCLTLFFPLSLVWTLLDVWLDQPQQGVVPAESHRDRGELPTRPGPADTAQPLCHELHGELREGTQEGGEASTGTTSSAQGTRGLWEVMQGRSGWLWQTDTDVW